MNCWRRSVMLLLSSLVLVALVPCTFSRDPFQGVHVHRPLNDHVSRSDRLSLHLSTDKVLYKPGQTVWIRGVLVDSYTHLPTIAMTHPEQLQIEILSPKADIIDTMHILNAQPEEHATYGGSWSVPNGTPGGEYTLRASMPGIAETSRKFQVRALRATQLNIDIDFVTKALSAGELAQAWVTVSRVEGGFPPAGTPVRIYATVDGNSVDITPRSFTLDARGKCLVRFTLPEAHMMPDGQGSLTVTVDDSGVVESSGKTIPLVLQSVPIQFFPEGGALVAGVRNRCYFEALTSAGLPLDISARLVRRPLRGDARALTNSSDVLYQLTETAQRTWLTHPEPLSGDETPVETTQSIVTVHEGRGWFEFTPTSGFSYALRVTQPSGVRLPNALPGVFTSGVVLRASEDTYASGSNNSVISFSIAFSAGAGEFAAVTVELFQISRSLGKLTLTPKFGSDGTALLSSHFTLPDTAHGVLRLLVKDAATQLPLAERLVFRTPPCAEEHTTASPHLSSPARLRVDVALLPAAGTSQSASASGGNSSLTTTPASRVRARFTVTDAATGRPVKAVLGITVTDDKVFRMTDKRLRAPRLAPMVFLEEDVDRLEDAGAFLPLTHSDYTGSEVVNGAPVNSAQAIDLLLGTQGWRRFAYERSSEFVDKYDARAKRALRLVKPKPSYRAARMHRFGGADMMMEAKAMPLMARARGGEPVAEVFAVAAQAQAPMQDRDGLDMAAFAEDGAAYGDVQGDFQGDFQGEEELAGDNVADAMYDMDGLEGVDVAPQARPAAAALELIAERIVNVRQEAVMAAAEFKRIPEHFYYNTARRVYAHSNPSVGKPQATRSDFTDTIFWDAGIVTNDAGILEVQFDTSDAVTSFRILTEAFVHSTGASVPSYSSSDHVVNVQRAFYVAPKLPQELTAGDKLIVPISLVSNAASSVQVTTRASIRPMSSASGNQKGASTSGVRDNTTAASLISLSLPRLEANLKHSVPLEAHSRGRVYLEVHAERPSVDLRSEDDTSAPVPVTGGLLVVHSTATAKGEKYEDEVEHPLAVVSRGFPVSLSQGGVVGPPDSARADSEAESKAVFEFEVPEDMIPGSVHTTGNLYVSPAGNLLAAVNALIREPHGCFEQTSATTYPMVLALMYLQSHASPGTASVAQQAQDMLARGYDKLKSYEVPGGGFEWFGSAPAHESLTAMGVAQFTDMAKVRHVDSDLLKRSTDWLLSRRRAKTPSAEGNINKQDSSTPTNPTGAGLSKDSQGATERCAGFQRNPRSLDSFGAAPDIVTNAYIVWSLTSAGLKIGLDDQIEALIAAVEGPSRNDPYVIGLASASLFNLHRLGAQAQSASESYEAMAMRLARKLVAFQHAEGDLLGSVAGKTQGDRDTLTSITSSRGESLLVETTSVALLSWLAVDSADNVFTMNIEDAIRWLSARCKNGLFGSTQGTVLALKAIIAYDLSRTASQRAGEIRVFLNGEPLGTEPLRFHDKQQQQQQQQQGQSTSRGSSSSSSSGGVPAAVVRDGVLVLPSFARHVEAAFARGQRRHTVELRMSRGSRLPYSLHLAFSAVAPAQQQQRKPNQTADVLNPLKLSAKLARDSLVEGEGTQLLVQLVNTAPRGLPMSLAVIGLPAGLEPRHEQLQELVKSGSMAFYELFGQELVLYWRSVAPSAEISLSLDLTAIVPGVFTGRASRTYLYYTNEAKNWHAPLSVQIAAQN